MILKIAGIVAFVIVFCVFVGLHTYRLIKAEKNLSVHTIKMQLAVTLGCVLAIVGVIEALPKEAITGLLGMVVGAAVASKGDKE